VLCNKHVEINGRIIYRPISAMDIGIVTGYTQQTC
jgi:hypothetical protein